ncbi:MAG: ThuA domain-containing protein [Luteolibacter sp.]|uniref:ThuA domain-containing protein n=1 Tax=Luteolibacter sp. TaxID=1962973 RepID=UPI0032675A58
MKTNLSKISRLALCAFALAPALSQPLAAQSPESTEPMGQKFANPKLAKTLRVLLVGSGSSHDFPKYFLGSDEVTLKAAGGMDVAATPNLEEALALLPEADVLVFSGNHDQYGKEEFQKALNDFADKRKGLVFLHAATWDHSAWKGYNDRFINGKTPNHGKGDFEVTVKDTKSPLMKGVPATFKIYDENYHFEPGPKAKYDICAENAPDGGPDPHASVWTVKDRKTRIVCITLGHDDKAHDNPAYKAILTNSVNWVAGR